MTTLLSDIAQAMSTYTHDHVEARIARVTGNLEPSEEGTLTLRITNAGEPDGVRLTDVFIHLNAVGDAVTLKPNSSALLACHATADLDGPTLEPDAQVSEMFVFFRALADGIDGFNSTLDVGEATEMEIPFHAEQPGEASFTAHVHASVAFEDLFGRSRGTDATKPVVIHSESNRSARTA